MEQPKQKRVEQQQQTVVQKTVDETVTKTVPIFEPVMEQMELGKMRSAEGGSVALGGMKYTAYKTNETEPMMNMKPQLKVIKSNSVSFKVSKPTRYEEEVIPIADNLLERFVVIVNYELVDQIEQRRIGDFLNGVCYATDGRVEQISERIVVYIPEGIDIEAALASGYMR